MNSRGTASTARRVSIPVLVGVLLLTMVTLGWGKLTASRRTPSTVLGPSAHRVAQRAAQHATRGARATAKSRAYTPALVNLTISPADEQNPTWGPNGELIAFTSNGTDEDGDGHIDTISTDRHLFTMKADGSGLIGYDDVIPTGSVLSIAWRFDESLLFAVVKEGSNYSLVSVTRKAVAGDASTLTTIYTTTKPIKNLTLSPNSQLIFFDMISGGKSNIYRLPVSGNTSLLFQLTTDAGNNRRPIIANLGRDLIFESDRDNGGFYRIYRTDPNTGIFDPQQGVAAQQLTTPPSNINDTEAIPSSDNSLLFFTSTRLTESGDTTNNTNIWWMRYSPETASGTDPNVPIVRFFDDIAIKANQISPAPQIVPGTEIGQVYQRVAFVTNKDTNQDIYLGELIDNQAPYIIAPPVTALATTPTVPQKIFRPADTVHVSVNVVDHQTGVRAVWLQIKDPDPAVLDFENKNHVITIPSQDLSTSLNNVSDVVPVPPDNQMIDTVMPVEFGLLNPSAAAGEDPYPSLTDKTHHPGYYARAGREADPNDEDIDALFDPLDEQIPGMNGVHEGDGYPEVSPYWIPMYDDGKNGDLVANDGIYTCKWKTPIVPSDYYLDIIVEDKTNVAKDTGGNWHGQRRRFDNVSGCTTIVNMVGGKRILFVDDYIDGQRFLSQGLPPVESHYDAASYLNSLYYFMTTTRAVLEDGSVVLKQLPTAFTPGEPEFGGADVWRIMARGPVPDNVINSYMPTMITQFDYETGRIPKTATHNEKLVVWVSPHAYYQLLGSRPVQQDGSDVPIADLRTGSLVETATQQRVKNYLDRGGNLFVIGADLPSGMSNAASINFMDSYLGARLCSPSIGSVPSPGEMIHFTPDLGAVARPGWSSTRNTWTYQLYPGAAKPTHEFYGTSPNWYGATLADTRWNLWRGIGGARGQGIYQVDLADPNSTCDHNILPLNSNGSFYATSPHHGGGGCWDTLWVNDAARAEFLLWDARGGANVGGFNTYHIAGSQAPGTGAAASALQPPPVVGVSKEHTSGARSVFWTMAYEHLSSVYRDLPVLDTFEWMMHGSLRGFVVHGGNDQMPIPDALVRVSNGSTPIAAVRTDATGTFIIKGLRSTQNLTVEVVANGYQGVKTHTTTILCGKITDDWRSRFYLYRDPNTGSIWGYVTRNSLPVVNATVVATPVGNGSAVETHTYESGWFELDNLESGEYTLTATDPQTQQSWTLAPNPVLGSGERARFDVQFGATPPPVNGELHGKVTNTVNSSAIPGATVELLQNLQVVKSTTADANGDYKFTALTAGTYTVRGSAPNYNSLTVSDIIFDPAQGATVNLPLTPTGGGAANAVVYGRVYNGATTNPLAGATVQLLVGTDVVREVLTTAQFATTPVNYNFTFTVPAGVYTLRVTAVGRRTYEQTLELSNGQEVSNLDIQMVALLAISPGISLFALPGDYGTTDFSTIFGVAGSELTGKIASYRATGGYYFYTGAATLPVEPARGYWIKSDVIRYVQQAGTAIGGTEPFVKTLTPGWNLIGNPFTFAVDVYDCQLQVAGAAAITWSKAQETGLIGGPIYMWDSRKYLPSLVLQPYTGYWIYAKSACTLSIPRRTSSAPAREDASRAPSATAWRVRLEARAGEYSDTCNYFGVAPNASDGCDYGLDNRKPPKPLGTSVTLAFQRDNWGQESGAYTTDILTATPGDKRWHFRVETNAVDTDVVLSWPELATQLPKGYQAILTDGATGQQCFINTTRQYVFRPDQTGAREFDLQVLANAPVLQVTGVRAIGGDGRTPYRIAFSLSQPATVTLVMRSQAGRLVRRVTTDLACAAGANTIAWDGRDANGRLLPRGSYLCEIRAYDAIGRLAHGNGLVLTGTVTHAP